MWTEESRAVQMLSDLILSVASLSVVHMQCGIYHVPPRTHAGDSEARVLGHGSQIGHLLSHSQPGHTIQPAALPAGRQLMHWEVSWTVGNLAVPSCSLASLRVRYGELPKGLGFT